MKNKYTEKQKRITRRFRTLSVVIFAAIMLAGGVMGALIFLRPKVSEVEKRELTKFPKITAASFLDGTFFSDVAVWYSDTFPAREKLVAADLKLKSLYGVEPDTMMVGESVQADDIPELDSTEDTGEDLSAEPEVETFEAPTTLPTTTEMEEDIQSQIQKNLYVKGDAAYTIYYFVQEKAEQYIGALNHLAQNLNGKANVYSILVPDNSSIVLSEEEARSLGGSDEEEAIKYYYGSYSNVTPVPTYLPLKEHSDEYLYFRTDHHWTQLGAYYVYESFCQVKGWTPENLKDHQMVTYDSFLGSFYTTLQNSAMAENPDIVYAYYPKDTNDMTYWDKDGTEHEWNVIGDVSTWNKNSKYLTFIGGDNPLTIIDNPEITDGSSCLVLKESYGNCFVPFLVDHYDTVYVIDFRYTQENLTEYVEENQIDDVIIMNNLSIITSEKAVDQITALME